MAEHSPLPWNLGGTRHGKYSCVIVASNNAGDYVAEVVDHPNWRENGNYIVRAVNAHEGLLAACKAGLVALISEWGECGGDEHCESDGCVMCQMQAAINKAEGTDHATA